MPGYRSAAGKRSRPGKPAPDRILAAEDPEAGDSEAGDSEAGGLTAGGLAGGDPEAQRARGRDICLRLLATTPRTRAQLADAMRRRHIPEEVASAVLDQLTEARLIDDAMYAKAWVESRHHSRGLSGRSLKQELRHRGVDDDDIAQAVETLDPDQEIETARRLAERKLAATRGQPPDARARKVAGLLARKGYPAGLAFRLIRETMEAEGAEPPDLDGGLPDE